MPVEQIRNRLLTQIEERWKEFEAEESDIFEVFVKFTRFKNTIELGLSLGLISMGEYLSWDTKGDHLYHSKSEAFRKKDEDGGN